MIPLLVERNYRPKGWLGLILGTRMYYSFVAAEADDDVAFEKRLDAVVREIGGRCRPVEPTPLQGTRPAAVATSGGASGATAMMMAE